MGSGFEFGWPFDQFRNSQNIGAFRSVLAARAIAVAAVSLFSLTPANAQQVPQAPFRLPSGAEPGRQLPVPVMPLPSAPGQPIAVPKALAVQAPKGAEKVSFTLNAVDIVGVTAFTADDLKPLYAELLGKQVTVADMFKVANDLELRYRNAGFVTTRVIVPEQTIDNGRFRIQVIEGFVSEIDYPDDIGPAKAAVEMLMNVLRGVTPINVSDIERRMLVANDLPGLTVHASLGPSKTELGGSIITVHAERKVIDASLTFDNRNTPFVGSYETVAQVAFNGIGSHADQLSLNTTVSTPFKRSLAAGAAYQALLTGSGLIFSATANYSQSSPGESLDKIDIKSRVLSEQIGLDYPIIRSRLENLHAIAQFEFRDIDTNLNHDALNRDNLRIFRVGLAYDRTDSWDGLTAAKFTIHQGLDIFDATQHGDRFASRSEGYENATKFTAGLTRIQQLPADFSFLATVTGQIATKSLLASEQLGLGGPSFARGYDDGEVAGDKGWAGSIEVRYTPPPAKYLPAGLQAYVYFDGGQVWGESEAVPSPHYTLASAGGGIRMTPLENLSANLEVDRPLDRIVMTQNGKPTRVFFGLTVHY